MGPAAIPMFMQMGQQMGRQTGDLASGIMGLLDYKSPSSAGMPYLNQIQGINQQYLNPYNIAGQRAMSNLQGQYGQLTSHPGEMLNQIGQDYHQSPGFQFALQQALQGAGHGAAAGGMAGSPMQQQQNMGIATQMGNQDYYNWLNNAQNMYGMGLQGEQGMMNTGFGAASGMSDNISQALADQAAMAYQGQNASNQNQAASWGDIFSGLFGGGK